jgi:hypothetical protein
MRVISEISIRRMVLANLRHFVILVPYRGQTGHEQQPSDENRRPMPPNSMLSLARFIGRCTIS